MHHYVFVRTTIDLPKELHRALKARAGLTGITFRELVQSLIEQGLRTPTAVSSLTTSEPPIIIVANGIPIPAVSRQELMQSEEDEDTAKYA